VSDIFREVEEDVRRERLEKLWKQYGDYVIAAVAVLVIGVAGFKFWQHYQFVQTQKAAAAYLQTMEASGNGKPLDAARNYAEIAKSAPGGYALAAQLSQANMLLEAGKRDEAVALYRKIAAKDSKEIGETARVRAAWALADSAPKNELQDLLAPVNDDKSGWRFMAREILAYADFRDGRLNAAQTAFKKLSEERDAPGTTRQRALAMATLIRTGVGDYGKLPEPDAETDKPADGAADKPDTSKPAKPAKGTHKK
jgi:hypothetical protein